MAEALKEEVSSPFAWVESKAKQFKEWIAEDIEDSKNVILGREPDLSPKPIAPTLPPPPPELKQFASRIISHDEYYRSLEKPRQVRVMGGSLTVLEPLELQEKRRQLKQMNDFVEASDITGALLIKGTAELVKAEAGARVLSAGAGILVRASAEAIVVAGAARGSEVIAGTAVGKPVFGGTPSPKLAQTVEQLQAEQVPLRGNFVNTTEADIRYGSVKLHGGAVHDIPTGTTYVNMDLLEANASELGLTPKQVLQHEMGHFGQTTELALNAEGSPLTSAYIQREGEASLAAAKAATSPADVDALLQHALDNFNVARMLK